MDLKKIERTVNRDKENPWVELLCTQFANEGYKIALSGKPIDLNKFSDDSYHKLYDMQRLPFKIQLKNKKGGTIHVKAIIDKKNQCRLVKTKS